MEITTTIGAIIVSLFIALNVMAMYLYVKRSISLDPESPMNHAVSDRFDSEDEHAAYHQQHYRNMAGIANRRLLAYREYFARERVRLDPSVAAKLPDPVARYEDLK